MLQVCNLFLSHLKNLKPRGMNCLLYKKRSDEKDWRKMSVGKNEKSLLFRKNFTTFIWKNPYQPLLIISSGKLKTNTLLRKTVLVMDFGSPLGNVTWLKPIFCFSIRYTDISFVFFTVIRKLLLNPEPINYNGFCGRLL